MSTKNEYEAFLAEVRNSTGIESLSPDDSGLVSVRVDDSYNLNLQYVEASGKILCFVEVAQLPSYAPAGVFRDLLVGGLFGRDTAGGHFALDPDSETVVYQYYFDFDRAVADPDDFVATLEKILQLCEIWAERIRRVLAGEESENGNPCHGGLPNHDGSFRLDP